MLGNIRFRRLNLVAAILVSLLGAASCSTVVGRAVAGAVGATTGPGVEGDPGQGALSPRPPGTPSAAAGSGLRGRGGEPSAAGGEAIASIYVSGAVPGWERGLTTTYDGGTGPYFAARFFRGHCPALFDVPLGGRTDPFGPVEPPSLEPFAMGNSLHIDPGYAPFGRVEPGGPGTVGYQWQTLSLYGMGGGGCGFPGIRLLSFGKDDVRTLHR